MSIFDIILDFLGYSITEAADRHSKRAGRIVSWMIIIAAIAALVYWLANSEVRIW
jgi:hypothetical protein